MKNSRSVEFRILTDEIAKNFEMHPFNAPVFASDFSEDDFDDEWWEVRDSLKKLLSEHALAYESYDKQNDFALSIQRGDSRWIYVTFFTPKLWSRDFGMLLADFLAAVNPEYAIGCVTELTDDNHALAEPLIYLVATKDCIYGQAKELDSNWNLVVNNRLLTKVGFAITAIEGGA